MLNNDKLKQYEYYKTNNGILYCGDSIEIMNQLGLKVDAIITDPPYGISRKNNFGTLRDKNGNLKYKNGIDFGEWDKGFDELNWIRGAINLLNKNGSMLVFNSWQNIGAIAKYAEQNGMIAKDLIRWEKSNPVPRNINRRYVVDTEYIVWLAKKGARWTFNRIDKKFQRPKFVTTSVLGKEKTIHRTQKPLRLMKQLIEIHTNKGDIAMDIFAGSGSTLVACEEMNRKWIGIEISEEYCEIIKGRLQNNIAQLKLL